MPRQARTPERIAREALEKIVNCSINDPAGYCRYVDATALEALIEIEHMTEYDNVPKSNR